MYGFFVLFFFFQAEDGIRDSSVTGVQTCALPIYDWTVIAQTAKPMLTMSTCTPEGTARQRLVARAQLVSATNTVPRSEERRVGKECRSRWWPCREETEERTVDNSARHTEAKKTAR